MIVALYLCEKIGLSFMGDKTIFPEEVGHDLSAPYINHINFFVG